MRRSFLIWLLLLIGTAYVVTGAVAYWKFLYHAEQQIERFMVTRLGDLLELVEQTSTNMQRLRRANDDAALSRTRAMAEIVRLNPAMLDDQELLQGLCNDLGAEQAAITDAKGIIRAAVPASYRGMELAADKDARKFLPCIDTPGYECVQHASEQVKSTGLRYAGVHRLDEDGLIRLGFRPNHERRAKDASIYARLAANYRLGANGRIVAFRGGAPLNKEALPGPSADFLALPTGKLERLNVNGAEYFSYAMERNGIRLVGIIPLSELHPMGMRSARSHLLTNCFVFAAVFVLVGYLLQRVVIQRLNRVNETLRRIANGEMDARVNVVSTPEFARLSTGINAMLDALRMANDQSQTRIRKELELARAMQRNALPNTFPAFPGCNDVDIYATLMPASSVGGDFYDYFMPDSNHLTFMVAGVSETGVPAALYMMRSLSIIRSYARNGNDPATVLSKANSRLNDGRTADISVSIFYGSLELSSGLLTCVNAGHEVPLIQHLGEKGYSELKLVRHPVLGPLKKVLFENQQVQLKPGDRLFFHTYGLLIAKGPQDESYGRARLLKALAGDARTLAEVPGHVRSNLRRFTEDEPQEHDITLLALEYKSIMRQGGKAEFLAGKPETALALLQEGLEAVLAAPLDIDCLRQAVERLLAALPEEMPVTLELGCSEQQAELIFTLPGNAANPLSGLELEGIDTPAFHEETEGNRITLSKTLG